VGGRHVPEWASFVDESLERYRADVHEAHHALIEFTDRAVAEAERLSARG